jgi:hypothetical protein
MQSNSQASLMVFIIFYPVILIILVLLPKVFNLFLFGRPNAQNNNESKVQDLPRYQQFDLDLSDKPPPYEYTHVFVPAIHSLTPPYEYPHVIVPAVQTLKV